MRSEPQSSLRDTGGGRCLDRAPLHGGEEGSWRRRPRAATERGRTDTCWQLFVTAATPGAFFRLCSPLPTAPSPFSRQVWVRAQEKRTQILNGILSRCRNLPKAYIWCVGSGSSPEKVTLGRAPQASGPGLASHPGQGTARRSHRSEMPAAYPNDCPVLAGHQPFCVGGGRRASLFPFPAPISDACTPSFS